LSEISSLNYSVILFLLAAKVFSYSIDYYFRNDIC